MKNPFAKSKGPRSVNDILSQFNYTVAELQEREKAQHGGVGRLPGPKSERRVDDMQEPAGVTELRDIFHSTRLYTTHTAIVSYEAIGQTLNYIRELEFQLIRAKKQLQEEKDAVIHNMT
ncbi:MAG: hypothetical protein KA802_11410 [Saprospiraceae bacterium]|nr:hypothetical protein [Saprospiraceae bacterium]